MQSQQSGQKRTMSREVGYFKDYFYFDIQIIEL